MSVAAVPGQGRGVVGGVRRIRRWKKTRAEWSWATAHRCFSYPLVLLPTAVITHDDGEEGFRIAVDPSLMYVLHLLEVVKSVCLCRFAVSTYSSITMLTFYPLLTVCLPVRGSNWQKYRRRTIMDFHDSAPPRKNPQVTQQHDTRWSTDDHGTGVIGERAGAQQLLAAWQQKQETRITLPGRDFGVRSASAGQRCSLLSNDGGGDYPHMAPARPSFHSYSTSVGAAPRLVRRHLRARRWRSFLR